MAGIVAQERRVEPARIIPVPDRSTLITSAPSSASMAGTRSREDSAQVEYADMGNAEDDSVVMQILGGGGATAGQSSWMFSGAITLAHVFAWASISCPN